MDATKDQQSAQKQPPEHTKDQDKVHHEVAQAMQKHVKLLNDSLIEYEGLKLLFCEKKIAIEYFDNWVRESNIRFNILVNFRRRMKYLDIETAERTKDQKAAKAS